MKFFKDIFLALISYNGAPLIVSFLLSGVLWVSIFALCKRVFHKKKPTQKTLEFTLPDRENTFVRARLSTALNPEFRRAEYREERLAIGFSQAVKLLEKVQVAPLSPAERMEITAMRETFDRYKDKELFSSSDVAGLNERFSRLLKLSAKYAV